MGVENRPDLAEPGGRSERRVALALGAWQLALHLWPCVSSRDPRLWPPHAVAYLHDWLVLGALLGVAAIVRRLTARRGRTFGRLLSVTVVVAGGMGLAVYPQVLREYLAFPVNVLSAGDGSARVLVTEYLGLKRLWPAVAALGIALAALAVPSSRSAWPRARRLAWAGVLLLGLLTSPRSPHPLVHSLAGEVQARLASRPRTVPSLRRPPRRGGDATPAAPTTSGLREPLTADHVFLVVLEGVTAADFEREFLPSSRFLSRVSGRSTSFRRYFATNLDSYTSLIAMLTSVQVPYRAYADESLYGAVNQADSLTRTLRGLGYFTLFASTYAYQPFVPTRGDWDRVMDRGDLRTLEGWVSLGSSRMEAATEDRAALPDLVDVAASKPRCFVLHELVYGHSTEWRARTGQSQLAYYDTYLVDLLDRLEARGLGERSLLVVVSDHGDRSKATVAENYRVPLLVVGARGSARADDEVFRSHLDLRGIVASYLTGTALPPPRAGTYVVGSTERWVYGEIEPSGGHLIIDDPTGAVASAKGALAARTVQEGFQALLDRFGVRYGE